VRFGDADLDGDMLVGYTYSVPSQVGATYVWSVSSGATIWSGQSTTAIQVIYNNSAGPFTVSVTIDNGCGTVNPSRGVTKTHNGFLVGLPRHGHAASWTNEIGTLVAEQRRRVPEPGTRHRTRRRSTSR
jgi:hypothetical protein